MFYRWLECNNLCQVINEPTRITQHTATRLDLIITNGPGYFVNSGTLSPPANCDHSLIFADLNIALSKPKCYKRFIWMFNRLSEAGIKKLYSDPSNIDWDEKKFFICQMLIRPTRTGLPSFEKLFMLIFQTGRYYTTKG